MLTLEEAKEILKIDADYFDNRLQSLINILPHYIYERTGYPVERQNEEPLCHLLETFLIRDFFCPTTSTDAKVVSTICSLMTTIKYQALKYSAGTETE